MTTTERSLPKVVGRSAFIRSMDLLIRVMVIFTVIVIATVVTLSITGVLERRQANLVMGPLAGLCVIVSFARYRLYRMVPFRLLAVAVFVGPFSEILHQGAVVDVALRVVSMAAHSSFLLLLLIIGSRRNNESTKGWSAWLELTIVGAALAAWFVAAVPPSWQELDGSEKLLYQLAVGPGLKVLVFIPAVLLLARLSWGVSKTSNGPLLLVLGTTLQYGGYIASAAEVTGGAPDGGVLVTILGVIGVGCGLIGLLKPSVVLLGTGEAPWSRHRSWQRTAVILCVPAVVIGAVAIGASSWSDVLWPVLLLVSIGLIAVRARSFAEERIERLARKRAEAAPTRGPITLTELTEWFRGIRIETGGRVLDVGVVAVISPHQFHDTQQDRTLSGSAAQGLNIDQEITAETVQRLRSVLAAASRMDPGWQGEFEIAVDRDRLVAITVGHHRNESGTGNQLSAFAAERLASSFVRWLALPYRTSALTVRVDFAMGYASSELTAEGDLGPTLQEAIWAAQTSELGRPEGFDPALRVKTRRRAQLGALLDEAVIDGTGLSVVYEPLVDLISGRAVGAEALARWNPEGWGPISPGEFIPIAEQTRSMLDLGEWVLRTACLAAARPGNELRVSVNISGIELADKGFHRRFLRVLEETGVDPAFVTIEITETVIGQVLGSMSSTLTSLTAQGVRLSMDDFGTEASGLTRMLAVPWHTIKLDRSMISGLESVDSPRASLVRAVVRLAGDIGADVVAEGVEDRRTLQLVADLGCNVVQGWVFGKGRPELQDARISVADLG